MTEKLHTPSAIGRRLILAGGVGALAMPWIARPALAAGDLVIRNPGGVWDEVFRKVVYDPFTKETGVTVTVVAATQAKLMAMYRSGNNEIDLVDAGDGALEYLRSQGALTEIDYGSWKHAKPSDIYPEVKLPTRVANCFYSMVMAYNTQAFPNGHPKDWAEVWDLKKFPGARTLADINSGEPPIEFALLADGVPMDKLYPLDLPRAFKALSKVKPAISKFWDTGALSAQMFSDKQVVLGSVWNGRLQVLIDKGAPLALEWNQNMLEAQAYGVMKGAKNAKNAQMLIDYALAPERQAQYSAFLSYGPTNKAAAALIPKEKLAVMPGSPGIKEKGFLRDVVWWDKNRDAAIKAWNNWALS